MEIQAKKYTESKTAGSKNEGTERFDEACRIFFNWRDSVKESAEEYEKRIKKAKILRVLRSVIEKELDDGEKELLRLRYSERYSCFDIAESTGISRTKAFRSLRRIESTVGGIMKYVMEYAQLDLREEITPLCVSKAVATMAAEAVSCDSLAHRLRKSREEKLLSIEAVSLSTGIDAERFREIEENGKMSLDEFIKLTLFYSVSADYLIYGV